MSEGTASTRAKNKYNAKAYDRIALQVKKGKKDEIKAHADSQGESLNSFINRSIDEAMINKLQQERTLAQISIKPRFDIVYDNNISTINNRIIIPIKIKNTGVGTATKVSLKAYQDNTFFECPSEEVKHNVYEYLSEYHALPGEEITFSIWCENKTFACNVFFALSYSDIAEREYEQKFRIQYGSMNECSVSKNYHSYDPVCIHDIL